MRNQKSAEYPALSTVQPNRISLEARVGYYIGKTATRSDLLLTLNLWADNSLTDVCCMKGAW